jgi:nucleotide-binding universal stress UspA family protein
MFQHIFVPLDGSARSEQALPVAVHLAHTTHATVTLLHVISPPSEFMKRVGEIVLPALLDEDELAARTYLERVAQTSAFEEIPTTIKVVVGHPAQEILSAAHADRADLLVMCSHGESDPTQWSIGSIAQKVARHASSPVLLLHEGSLLLTKQASAPAGPVRVLVPLDGSEHAEGALMHASKLAAALSAPAAGELHLTRMVSSQQQKGSSADEEERSRQYLNLAIKRLQQQMQQEAEESPNVHMSCSVMTVDDAASGIMQAARMKGEREPASADEGTHVIALTPYGHGGPQFWALGSTAERVLQAARHPLLIVR